MAEFDMDLFTERILGAMHGAGMNQSELCQAAGLDRAYITNLRSKRAGLPNVQTILALADVLDMPPAYLAGWSDEPTVTFESLEDLPAWAHRALVQILKLPESQQMVASYMISGLMVGLEEEQRLVEGELAHAAELVGDDARTLARLITALRRDETMTDRAKIRAKAAGLAQSG